MTPHPSPSPAFNVRIASLALLLIILAACGTSDNDEASTPTETPQAAAPGEPTVESLVNRINTAWTDVTRLRVTSASGPIPAETGSGTAVPQGSYTVEEWTSPNDRRILEMANDEVVNEQVYIDGVIYMKGAFVGTAVAPEVGPETWVILDASIIPPDTPVGNRVAYLTREGGSPFMGMTPEILSLPVNESGSVQVGGRSCTLYTFGDPGGTGESIRYEIALDENDLPCQVVQRGGGYQNSSVYQINSDDIRIISPDAGTPVSGTPEG